MTLASRPLRALVLAALVLPLAACDETGGLGADADTAVQDARLARQNGDYAAAITVLEDAHARQPEHAPVRVELASTLLERDGINLLDLERISRYVTEGDNDGARTAPASAPRGSCALAADPTATAFDPTALAGFQDLVAHAASVREALDLLTPVMPEALTGFSICTNVVDGQLAYDRAGALAELSARLGGDQALVARALAVHALARLIDAYLFVSTELPEQTTWYRRADGTIAICADDEEALMEQAEEAVVHLGEAVLALDARASILGSNSVAADLVEVALDAFEEIRDAVGDYCAGA